MPVTEETEAEVRAKREAAVEYAERVLAGEEPWNDESPESDDDIDDGVDDPESGPSNDDVGENGEADGSPLFFEVDQDRPAPEPEE